MNKSEKKLLETRTRDLVVTVEDILGYRIGVEELKKAVGDIGAAKTAYIIPDPKPEWGKA